MNDSIVIGEDDFILNNRESSTMWITELSNGQKIFQDDGRPDYQIPSWLRLRNYCIKYNLYIQKMYLQFRSHFEFIGENVDGFYWVKSCMGGFGMDKTIQYYTCGPVVDNIAYLKRWQIPELIYDEEEERLVDNDDVCLIRKRNVS